MMSKNLLYLGSTAKALNQGLLVAFVILGFSKDTGYTLIASKCVHILTVESVGWLQPDLETGSQIMVTISLQIS